MYSIVLPFEVHWQWPTWLLAVNLIPLQDLLLILRRAAHASVVFLSKSYIFRKIVRYRIWKYKIYWLINFQMKQREAIKNWRNDIIAYECDCINGEDFCQSRLGKSWSQPFINVMWQVLVQWKLSLQWCLKWKKLFSSSDGKWC